MTTTLRQVSMLLSVPALLGATSAASLAVGHRPRRAAAPAVWTPPRGTPTAHRASGKLLHVNERLGALVVEVAVETADSPRRLQTFVIDRGVLVGQQGHALAIDALLTGRFVTIDYVTIDGASHARRVTLPDFPGRV